MNGGTHFSFSALKYNVLMLSLSGLVLECLVGCVVFRVGLKGLDHQMIPKRNTAPAADGSKVEGKLYTFQECDNHKNITFNLKITFIVKQTT